MKFWIKRLGIYPPSHEEMLPSKSSGFIFFPGFVWKFGFSCDVLVMFLAMSWSLTLGNRARFRPVYLIELCKDNTACARR